MERTRLSLKWLEVFQQTARSGSVQSAAVETGLSVSTVSHHLQRLEKQLGVSLMDHSQRPMVLTPAGGVFLRHIDEALRLIRKAEIEVASGSMFEARSLRLGLLEDFDSDIAPELTRFLAAGMKNCEFKILTRPSHEILHMVRNRGIDIGLATKPLDDVSDLVEYPILRDPFLLAVPAGHSLLAEEYLAGTSSVPFLRYSQNQIMGRQIETQLKRLRISLPNRFEIESNQSIMEMVAEGVGWTITTPTSYFRAKRFHKQIALHRFPGKSFARYLSVFTTDEYAQNIAKMIASTLSRLIRLRLVEPTLELNPWLADTFFVLPEKNISPKS